MWHSALRQEIAAIFRSLNYSPWHHFKVYGVRRENRSCKVYWRQHKKWRYHHDQSYRLRQRQKRLMYYYANRESCIAKCVAAKLRKRHQKVKEAGTETRLCRCGTEIVVRVGHGWEKNRRWCSRACRVHYWYIDHSTHRNRRSGTKL